jgi:acyl-CoA synthetase (NDP forming)
MTTLAQKQQWQSAGFLVYEDAARATAALAAMGRLGASFARAQNPAPAPAALPAFSLPAQSPSEAGAKALLAAAGVAFSPEQVCSDAASAVQAAQSFGYPVVLKIVSPDIAHKTEIGGVLLNVGDAAAVQAGFATLLQRAAEKAPTARIEGVLVAKQMTGGVECIVGVHRDPVFGPVAAIGLGGIFVEVLRDVVLRRCPFSPAEAEAMIGQLRAAAVLQGARGKPPADIKALAQMLAQVSQFAHQAGERLQGIDLNPVLVLPQGQGAYALDALVQISE